MTQSTAAAVHIQGDMLRCAEIERGESGLVLRRLAQESADLDVAHALWAGERAAEAADQVRALVDEMLGGTAAPRIGWVTDPLDAYSFFMPLSRGLDDADRERRIAYQAALVTDTRSSEALQTTSRSVRTAEVDGEAVEWVHVLAVPRAVAERMKALTASLTVPNLIRVTSPEAAAQVLRRPAPADQEAPACPYRLALGQYSTHTEYTLTRSGQWHHAHVAREARALENRVYYAVGFLNRIGVSPEQIEKSFVYGPDAAPSPDGLIAEVFGAEPGLLDPCAGLRFTGEHSADEMARLYVPCIGGALAAQPDEPGP